MEDEDSKVRRNLVMVSSTILLAAWLGIPISRLLEKALPGSGVTQEPWRFWVAEFAVLIYLAVRYRFAEEGWNYQTTGKAEFETILRQKILQLAQERADSFTKNGEESSIFQGQLVNSVAEASVRPDSTTRQGRPRVFVTLYEHKNPPWEFVVGVSFNWYGTDGSLEGSHSGKPIEVLIYGLDRIQINFKSRLHFWTYSSASIQYLIPVILGLTAVVGTLCKVFASFAATA